MEGEKVKIKKSIESLLGLSDRDFGKYLVNTDPIEGKIRGIIREEIIEKSLQCGYEEADKILSKIGKTTEEIDISLLAKRLGIIVRTEKDQNVMDYICFGTYEEPGIITLYEDNIKKGETLISKYQISGLQGINLMQIILAHEIFHYVEAKIPDLYINNYRIKLWKLGPYTHKSELICMGEIASMAFARRLLNLRFCPNILDVLLLYPHDEEQAESVYNQIMESAME